ncbi:hypothetical protein TH63_10995 [Rufibacter radiotolerans]|uniref:Uncharacterized protein n=1 Tax=Rufibacter radiotolerans TaxID=1379910 RepID=A0A0H4VQ36_9BACT|nr:hypothetical protein [Rufibacter radiotolerans]AKQ46047.1 hypothetical protein TH63_10995 [Rufibacter radiotolerans]
MNADIRQHLLAHIDKTHSAVEASYPTAPVYPGTPEYLEKRRLLLADLSLHLAQDALAGDFPKPSKVRQHLFAITRLYAELFPTEGFDAVAQLLSPEAVENISAG